MIAPDPIPPPVSLSGREARAALLMIAAMQDGMPIRIWDRRSGEIVGAAVLARRPIGTQRGMFFHAEWRWTPAWVYLRRACELRWMIPADLVGGRGDDIEARGRLTFYGIEEYFV